MATHEKKQFADLDEAQKLHLRLMAICHISFTEEDKNKYLPKLQNDEFLKKKIEESHRFVINYFEECSKIENFDEISLGVYNRDLPEFPISFNFATILLSVEQSLPTIISSSSESCVSKSCTN